MRATTSYLSKGFMTRSLDEFKRLASIALTSEGIKGPSGPLPLFNFHDAETLNDCKTMGDEAIGGFSKASLDFVPTPTPTSNSPSISPPPKGYARFHGAISTQLPADNPDVTRSGFAAWRTRDRPFTLFGRSLYNIDMYAYLALRIKSDGRSYLVNIQTESVVPEDLHQHRLFAKRPGEWETVLIKWNDFVRTNHGSVVEPQTEMLRQKVRTLGIGLTDRVPGPFELCIERVWATNDINETAENPAAAGVAEATPATAGGESHVASSMKKGGLKNKQGQRVDWNDR